MALTILDKKGVRAAKGLAVIERFARRRAKLAAPF
jgi:hypothetical protein